MKDCHIHLMPFAGPAEPPEVFLKKVADAGIDGGTIMSLPPASFRVDPLCKETGQGGNASAQWPLESSAVQLE